MRPCFVIVLATAAVLIILVCWNSRRVHRDPVFTNTRVDLCVEFDDGSMSVIEIVHTVVVFKDDDVPLLLIDNGNVTYSISVEAPESAFSIDSRTFRFMRICYSVDGLARPQSSLVSDWRIQEECSLC